MGSGNTWGRDAFSNCAARIPIPPNARFFSQRAGCGPRTRLFNFYDGASVNGRIDGTFGGSFRFDDYERAGDHKTDRAVYFRAVSDDADAQRDQLLEDFIKLAAAGITAGASRTAAVPTPRIHPAIGTSIAPSAIGDRPKQSGPRNPARPFFFPGAFPRIFLSA